MEKILNSYSAEQTEQIGASVAELLLSDRSLPRFVALYGDLGVGKTAFTRGFTHFAIPAAKVKSPTFALVNEYIGDKVKICHFDMYRIEGEDDLYSIGYDDYLAGNGYIIVEWSENIDYAIPSDAIYVNIERHPDGDDMRKITVTQSK